MPIMIEKLPINLILFSGNLETNFKIFINLLGDTNKSKPSNIKIKPKADRKSFIILVCSLCSSKKFKEITFGR